MMLNYGVRFRELVDHHQRMFPGLHVDVDKELLRYKDYAEMVSYYHTCTHVYSCLSY